jgi:hypothetical protein
MAMSVVPTPGVDTTIASGKEDGAEAGLVVTTIVAGPWVTIGAERDTVTLNAPFTLTVVTAGAKVVATPATVTDERAAPEAKPPPESVNVEWSNPLTLATSPIKADAGEPLHASKEGKPTWQVPIPAWMVTVKSAVIG